MRNKKAPLRDEIMRLKKERHRDLRNKGLNPRILERTFNEKGIPLRINGAERVNLNINPVEYENLLRVGFRLGEWFKLDADPLTSNFWKDVLDIVEKLLYLADLKQDELFTRQAEIDAEREFWRFKNE